MHLDYRRPFHNRYNSADIGPSWELMKQDVPEHRRLETIQEKLDALEARYLAKIRLDGERQLVLEATRQRAKARRNCIIIGGALVVGAVLLWRYLYLHYFWF